MHIIPEPLRSNILYKLTMIEEQAGNMIDKIASFEYDLTVLKEMAEDLKGEVEKDD